MIRLGILSKGQQGVGPVENVGIALLLRDEFCF